MLYKFDGKRPSVGKNSYVSELASVIGDVLIGDHCYIGHGVILRGDYGRIEIGRGSAVEEGVVVHAPPNELSKIGESVTIGHGAIIHSREIGNYAVIGMGAVLSIMSAVGEWTIIAEGGIVKQKQELPSRIVAAGNPVKIIRDITSKDIDFWSYGKQLYVDLAQKYLKDGMEIVQ